MALAFVFVTVLLDAIGFGIILPVLPKLIVLLTGDALGRAAVDGGWLLFVYASAQLVCAPILGNLSDRFGRRPVLFLSLFCFGIDYLVMALAPTLGWLFVGRALAGISGASITTANAYVADVSAPADRAKSFGLLGAGWGLGFILGPVLGGLLGGFGPRVPFLVAAGLAFANLIYGVLVLPETLAPERRRPFSFRRANPIGAVLQMRRYPVAFGLLGVALLYQVAHDVNPSTWTFYTMFKFGWNERQVGYSMGFVGLLVAIVQGGLIRAALPRLGERRAVVLGLTTMAIGFLGIAFASAGWMIYAALVPFAVCGFTMPALRGILSRQMPPDAQGELQGALASLVSLTAIVTPVAMTHLFHFFTSERSPVRFAGAPFLAAAALATASLLFFLRAGRREAARAISGDST